MAEAWFRSLLFTEGSPGPLPLVEGGTVPEPLVAGRAEAPLFGGNLSMLASLCGGPVEPSAAGRILFLEDVGEPAYRVDRMLVQLERSGCIQGVEGLAFGQFTCDPPEGAGAVLDVLREFAERVGVPTVAQLPFGHVEHNCLIPVGAHARVNGDDAQVSILEPGVRA